MREAVWRCRDHAFPLGARTLVMGIVNVTPDSFSDGGMLATTDDAVAHGVQLAADGADILDVGGESTRPGSDPVSQEQELARVAPVVAGLREAAPDRVALSVDTRRPEVARAALEAGASIVNDVTAAADPAMFAAVREVGSRPRADAHARRAEDDAARSTATTTSSGRCATCSRRGSAPRSRRAFRAIGSASIRGSGSARTSITTSTLLHDIASFEELRVPVLVGASRKRFIGELTGVDDPAERVEGTAGAVAWCAAKGVDVVRVHDVLEMTRVVRVVDAIVKGAPS